MSAGKSGHAVFVTGTDTGVGKTVISAALAYHFASKGLNVGIMKPVETGVTDISDLGPDAALLRWAAQSTDPADKISPYRFSLPASPHQAAQSAKTKIDQEKILEAFNDVKAGKDIVLVEGAGGLMVPVQGGFLMADLVKEMSIPALVVTQPQLGTLNHTLLTTFAAHTMGIDLCGMIINRMPEKPDEVASAAPHLLSSLASVDILGVLPEVTGIDKEKISLLSEAIGKLPTYSWLLNALGLTAQ
jgi:dethiobiotin synthetase